MEEGRWEHFEHRADIGVRGIGPTPAAAFEQAALALAATGVDPAAVHTDVAVAVACSAPDLELLLVDWLNALVYEAATRGLVFAAFAVGIAEDAAGGLRLTAVARGEPLGTARHRPAVEVKGATLTDLRVARHPEGWLAQCVVDV